MEKIAEIFKKLEEEHAIKIVYAVEAGSRAWGLESEDSDYDMRFVYVHREPKNYVTLKPVKETIDGFSPDRLYDWQGWELKKALLHISQMNPSICEWLYSPIIYIKSNEFKLDFMTEGRKLIREHSGHGKLLYHYRSMAKKNFKDHIENKQLVKIKKYLYVIRPTGMFLWLIKCNSGFNMFEIDFNKILIELKPHLDSECFENILNVIEKKKTMKEMDDEPRIKCIDEWIEKIISNTDSEIKQVETLQEGKKQSLDEYDLILHSFLSI